MSVENLFCCLYEVKCVKFWRSLAQIIPQMPLSEFVSTVSTDLTLVSPVYVSIHLNGNFFFFFTRVSYMFWFAIMAKQ